MLKATKEPNLCKNDAAPLPKPGLMEMETGEEWKGIHCLLRFLFRGPRVAVAACATLHSGNAEFNCTPLLLIKPLQIANEMRFDRV